MADSLSYFQYERKLFDFLRKKGFLEESLILEPQFRQAGGHILRPDIAIVDPETKTVLSIIELKTSKGLNRRYAAQLLNYISFFENTSVKGFLALPKGDSDFSFYELDKNNNLVECELDNILNFNRLNIKQTAETLSNLNSQRSKNISCFNIICFIFSLLSFLLIAVDFICSRYGIQILTPERLALFGVSIALAVIPFVQKLKMLGVEIERRSESQESSQSTS